jgi:hypothetical protein
MEIKVRYESIDSYGRGKSKTFTDLAKAQAYAQKWVGKHPEIGSGYAVSGDGIGKVTCRGCTLNELFPGSL